MKKIKLFALSGSLRHNSYNTAALQALASLAPDYIEVTIGQIDALPLFNPDLENTPVPALQKIKASLAAASGLIIASPEYAHGISGPMKNALDWLVGGEEFPYKPIMLINTSPRASHGMEALKEVLVTMSGVIIESACVSIPLLSSKLDRNGILQDHELSNSLKTGLLEFCEKIGNVKLGESIQQSIGASHDREVGHHAEQVPRIRQATVNDIQAIVPLVAEYWRFETLAGFKSELISQQIRRLLEAPNLGAAWIAFEDNAVVGYLLAVYVFSLEHLAVTAEIDELFVMQSKRGKGIGAKLVQAAEAEFVAAGYKNVSLQLARSNTAAREFYHNQGYIERSTYELLEKSL